MSLPRKGPRLVATAIGVWMGVGSAPAQQTHPAEPRSAEERPSEFRVGTDVVVLDVVVRDKKGRTVRDLQPGEVQVFEDRVPQEVVSFRLSGVEDKEPSPEEAARSADKPSGAPVQPATPRHVNLVTLVFDQLGAEGRQLARQAGFDLLKLADRPDLVVSVFQVKESLKLVQQFTSDREQLHQAIVEATGQLATQYTRATESLQDAAREGEEAQRRLQSAVQSTTANPNPGSIAQLSREADMARMAIDALRLTESLQREQQGHTSLFAILALARQQQRLAGRKTILYFADGLQVPPQLEHVLLGAISEANRANVSVYAVDTRGLSGTRPLEAAGDTLGEVQLAHQREMTSGGVGPVTKEQVKVSENALAALRMDTQGALGDLAVGTGGLLIANSNDVRKGIERAVGDLRGYYEVAYVPVRKDYDGKFRHLEVRVSRPGITVQTRSGYFAVPPEEGSARFAYEVDLLRALRAEPAPEQFPVRERVFRFGPEAAALRYTAVLEVPLAGIQFEPDDRGAVDRAHFSIITVLKDASGAVIERFSEDSPVFLPRQHRDALKQGSAVFTRSFRVAPGRYTLETAVVDQLGKRQSVRRTPLVVAPSVTLVSLSDVAVVKRSEAVPKGALATEDPFRVGESRLVPFVTDAHLQGSEPLSLFLVAYARRPEPRPQLLVELVRDGQQVVQSLLELPPADASGRIPYLAKLPTEGLASGPYEVRVLLKQGGATVQGKTRFTMDGPGTEATPPTALEKTQDGGGGSSDD